MLSSEQEPNICLVTEQEREFTFLLWNPEEKNGSREEISASILEVLIKK